MVDTMQSRFDAYAIRYNIRFIARLGIGGQDGSVLQTDRLTAVKIFERAERFHREVEVYHVLKRKGIFSVCGHAIPELLHVDDELLAIELTIVQPPFLLDFAGARRTDEVPDFEPHVHEWVDGQLRELFGGRADDVRYLIELFRNLTGYLLLDAHPGNISFVDMKDRKSD